MEEYRSFFNPFNAYKVLTYVPEWQEMLRTKKVPYIGTASVDMANTCQLDCVWCNSKRVWKKNIIMGFEVIDEIVRLAKIGFMKAICIGGGGESLCSPHFDTFVHLVHEYVKIGLVTNGINIDLFPSALKKCKWIGVSLDAGDRDTYKKLKRGDYFDRVIKNIEKLVEIGCKDVSVKYLIWPGNEKQIYSAACLSKELGANNFHVRPADFPWFAANKKKLYTAGQVETANAMMACCREIEDENFQVFTMTQKFGGELERKVDFRRCWAGLISCVFHPTGEVSLCCDRRGDDAVTLCNIRELPDAWGTPEHFEKATNMLNPKKCPRCTYRLHNLIFENVVIKDRMYCEFV